MSKVTSFAFDPSLLKHIEFKINMLKTERDSFDAEELDYEYDAIAIYQAKIDALQQLHDELLNDVVKKITG